jgi:hypothetical protein
MFLPKTRNSPRRPPFLFHTMKPRIKHSLLLLACYAALLAASFHAYKTATQFSGLRTDCLIALIIAPLAAAICLAGLIHLLDRPASAEPSEAPATPWYLRLTLSELNRLLLALHLLTTALALAAALTLIFQFPIPVR